MSDPAKESVGPSSPAPAAEAAPAAKAAQKNGSLPIVLVGALGAAAAIVVGVTSRGVAVPQASSTPPAILRVPTSAPRVNGATAVTSRWTNGTRWVSDRKSVAFELKSNNRVNVWMGQVQPLLIVRCMANRTEAFVYTDIAAQIEPGMDDRAVRVRFDDDSYVDERWLDSAEHKGLFAPNGATFSHRLLNAKTLRFQFTPHNAERAEVQFDVTGLRELIEPVQKKCGW